MQLWGDALPFLCWGSRSGPSQLPARPASSPVPQGPALTCSPSDSTGPLPTWLPGARLQRGALGWLGKKIPQSSSGLLESPLGKRDVPDGIPQLPAVYIAAYAAPAKVLSSQ